MRRLAESSEQAGPAEGNTALDALFAARPVAADEDEVYLWPETVPIWNHWQEVQTQWRAGMAGASGLDYAGVMAYLGAVEPDGEKRLEAFEAIREAERAALGVWAAKPKRT